MTSRGWRRAVLAEPAQPCRGLLTLYPFERIPFEWHMDERPAAERAVHPVDPAAAWGADPLAVRR